MTVREICKTVRPIIYDNHDEQWQYSTLGSCVVLGCEKCFYVATAAHVLNGYKPSQLLIPYEEGSDVFLPIKESFLVKTDEPEDTDHKDVLFLEIWKEELDRELWKPEYCFNLASNDVAISTAETRYWFSGYPSQYNEVDYEKCVLFHQATHISGRVSQINRYIGVDEIEFDDTAYLSSFDGFSGGGAFSFTPVGEGFEQVRFEGMILRATVESKKGFMLNASLMRNYILGKEKILTR